MTAVVVSIYDIIVLDKIAAPAFLCRQRDRSKVFMVKLDTAIHDGDNHLGGTSGVFFVHLAHVNVRPGFVA